MEHHLGLLYVRFFSKLVGDTEKQTCCLIGLSTRVLFYADHFHLCHHPLPDNFTTVKQQTWEDPTQKQPQQHQYQPQQTQQLQHQQQLQGRAWGQQAEEQGQGAWGDQTSGTNMREPLSYQGNVLEIPGPTESRGPTVGINPTGSSAAMIGRQNSVGNQLAQGNVLAGGVPGAAAAAGHVQLVSGLPPSQQQQQHGSWDQQQPQAAAAIDRGPQGTIASVSRSGWGTLVEGTSPSPWDAPVGRAPAQSIEPPMAMPIGPGGGGGGEGSAQQDAWQREQPQALPLQQQILASPVSGQGAIASSAVGGVGGMLGSGWESTQLNPQKRQGQQQQLLGHTGVNSAPLANRSNLQVILYQPFRRGVTICMVPFTGTAV